MLPDAIAEPMMLNAGIDRLAALHTAIDAVRRGGAISICGVYGGTMDPMPMFQLSTSRCSSGWGRPTCAPGPTSCSVVLKEADPWDVESFATHHLPLEDTPSAYEHFQKKEEGMVKVVFRP